jgi:hypothetical protein
VTQRFIDRGCALAFYHCATILTDFPSVKVRGFHFVFREIRRQEVPVSSEKPHGLNYSLMLHDYTDAVTLLADFWTDVDAILQEREGKG